MEKKKRIANQMRQALGCLKKITCGWAPSGVITNGEYMSGVEALSKAKKQDGQKKPSEE